MWAATFLTLCAWAKVGSGCRWRMSQARACRPALFMMSSRTLLKGAAIAHANPADVLREVNYLLHADNESAMFVTMIYAVFDPASGTFIYANGGHNPALIVHTDGSSTLLSPVGELALGVMSDIEYQDNTTILLPGGYRRALYRRRHRG